MLRVRLPRRRWPGIAARSALTVLSIAAFTVAQDTGTSGATRKRFRGLLGPENRKVRREAGRTYLWAKGDVSGTDGEWFDFTDSGIPTEELQFGIGKDRIRAIDDPLFVPPDDPRLLNLNRRPRPGGVALNTTNDLPVIGFVEGDDARAYPVPLLRGHELVNDRVAGKPVTVGW